MASLETVFLFTRNKTLAELLAVASPPCLRSLAFLPSAFIYFHLVIQKLHPRPRFGYGKSFFFCCFFLNEPYQTKKQDNKRESAHSQRKALVTVTQRVKELASLGDKLWQDPTQRWTCPGSEANRRRHRGWGQCLCVTPSSVPSLHT